MRKIFLLLGFVFMVNYGVKAQIVGQTPDSALKLCNTNVLNIPVVPAYYGGFFPQANSCLAVGALNPMFYNFTVSSTGTLGFNITPIDSCSDYDFILFDITGLAPNSVYTGVAPVISCNFSGLTACSAIGSITGAALPAPPITNLNNQDAAGTPINSMLNVTAGQTYMLCISNFDENAPGYQIEFTGTASIFDTTRPFFDFVFPKGCNNANCIDVQYVDNFVNPSIDLNGSCFDYSPQIPGIVPISANCIGCTGGIPDQGNIIRICFNDTLPPGMYWLKAKPGNDGNSVLDYCDNEQNYTDSVMFIIQGGGPPQMDSVVDIPCDVRQTHIFLNKYILCNSIAANGSDFTISGPQAVNVTSALPVNCFGGLTNEIRLDFSPLITTAGTYTISVNTGTDGNSLLDTCGQQLALTDSISFYSVASVVADFTGYMDYGCLQDTLLLDNNTLGAQTYTWDFGNGLGDTTFQPISVYAPHADVTYTVTLIGTNPDCADTTDHDYDFAHGVFADIQSDDSLCAFGYGSVRLTQTMILLVGLPVAPDSIPGITGNNFPASYIWYKGQGLPGDTLLNAPFANPKFTYGAQYGVGYAQGGSYVLTLVVKDTIGCSDTAYKTIWVDSIPYQHFFATDSLLCVGESLYLNDTVANHSIYHDFVFSDGYSYANVHDLIHLTPDPGNYTVTLTSYYTKCDSLRTSIDYKINSYPNLYLGADTMICPGVTGPISLIDINNIGAQYLWNTGSQTNSIIVTDPGTYWVQATDINGCVGADTIVVGRDCYVSLPNAFTPNGDNRDDYFIPRDLLSSGLTAFKMDIFNRWGELLFTTTSVDGVGWDGNWNGQPQPVGVYMYNISATFRNGIKKKYNGNITLLR